MPFQVQLVSIRSVHEKAIFHQMTKASSSPSFRLAATTRILDAGLRPVNLFLNRKILQLAAMIRNHLAG
jgi:hypothetical protein